MGPGKALGADSFLGVLGGVLESPNATIVAFGDMACGKAVDLAGAACVG